MTFAEFQRRELEKMLRFALSWMSVRRAAKWLGLPKSTVHDKARDFGIKIRRRS